MSKGHGVEGRDSAGGREFWERLEGQFQIGKKVAKKDVSASFNGQEGGSFAKFVGKKQIFKIQFADLDQQFRPVAFFKDTKNGGVVMDYGSFTVRLNAVEQSGEQRLLAFVTRRGGREGDAVEIKQAAQFKKIISGENETTAQSSANKGGEPSKGPEVSATTAAPTASAPEIKSAPVDDEEGESDEDESPGAVLAKNREAGDRERAKSRIEKGFIDFLNQFSEQSSDLQRWGLNNSKLRDELDVLSDEAAEFSRDLKDADPKTTDLSAVAARLEEYQARFEAWLEKKDREVAAQQALRAQVAAARVQLAAAIAEAAPVVVEAAAPDVTNQADAGRQVVPPVAAGLKLVFDGRHYTISQSGTGDQIKDLKPFTESGKFSVNRVVADRTTNTAPAPEAAPAPELPSAPVVEATELSSEEQKKTALEYLVAMGKVLSRIKSEVDEKVKLGEIMPVIGRMTAQHLGKNSDSSSLLGQIEDLRKKISSEPFTARFTTQIEVLAEKCGKIVASLVGKADSNFNFVQEVSREVFTGISAQEVEKAAGDSFTEIRAKFENYLKKLKEFKPEKWEEKEGSTETDLIFSGVRGRVWLEAGEEKKRSGGKFDVDKVKAAANAEAKIFGTLFRKKERILKQYTEFYTALGDAYAERRKEKTKEFGEVEAALERLLLWDARGEQEAAAFEEALKEFSANFALLKEQVRPSEVAPGADYVAAASKQEGEQQFNDLLTYLKKNHASALEKDEQLIKNLHQLRGNLGSATKEPNLNRFGMLYGQVVQRLNIPVAGIRGLWKMPERSAGAAEVRKQETGESEAFLSPRPITLDEANAFIEKGKKEEKDGPIMASFKPRSPVETIRVGAFWRAHFEGKNDGVAQKEACATAAYFLRDQALDIWLNAGEAVAKVKDGEKLLEKINTHPYFSVEDIDRLNFLVRRFERLVTAESEAKGAKPGQEVSDIGPDLRPITLEDARRYIAEARLVKPEPADEGNEERWGINSDFKPENEAQEIRVGAYWRAITQGKSDTVARKEARFAVEEFRKAIRTEKSAEKADEGFRIGVSRIGAGDVIVGAESKKEESKALTLDEAIEKAQQLWHADKAAGKKESFGMHPDHTFRNEIDRLLTGTYWKVWFENEGMKDLKARRELALKEARAAAAEALQGEAITYWNNMIESGVFLNAEEYDRADKMLRRILNHPKATTEDVDNLNRLVGYFANLLATFGGAEKPAAKPKEAAPAVTKEIVTPAAGAAQELAALSAAVAAPDRERMGAAGMVESVASSPESAKPASSIIVEDSTLAELAETFNRSADRPFVEDLSAAEAAPSPTRIERVVPPAEKKGVLSRFWKGTKELFTSKDFWKAAGKATYDTVFSVFGFKTFADLGLAIRKKGDIYNYFKERQDAKAERALIARGMEEVFALWKNRDVAIEQSDARVQERFTRVNGNILNSRFIDPAEKEKLIGRLEVLFDQYKDGAENKTKQRNEKVQKTLEAFLYSKNSTIARVRDVANTALVFAGMPLWRGAAYGAMSLVEMVSKGLDRAGQEGEKADRAKAVKEEMLTSLGEWWSAIRGKGRKGEGGVVRRGADFVSAFGTMARAVGLTDIVLGNTDTHASQAIDKLIGAFEQKELGAALYNNAVGGTVQTAERLAGIPGAMKNAAVSLEQGAAELGRSLLTKAEPGQAAGPEALRRIADGAGALAERRKESNVFAELKTFGEREKIIDDKDTGVFFAALVKKYPSLANPESLQTILKASTSGNHPSSLHGDVFKSAVDTPYEVLRDVKQATFEQLLAHGGTEQALAFLKSQNFSGHHLEYLKEAGLKPSSDSLPELVDKYQRMTTLPAAEKQALIHATGRLLQAKGTTEIANAEFGADEVHHFSLRGNVRFFGFDERKAPLIGGSGHGEVRETQWKVDPQDLQKKAEVYIGNTRESNGPFILDNLDPEKIQVDGRSVRVVLEGKDVAREEVITRFDPEKEAWKLPVGAEQPAATRGAAALETKSTAPAARTSVVESTAAEAELPAVFRELGNRNEVEAQVSTFGRQIERYLGNVKVVSADRESNPAAQALSRLRDWQQNMNGVLQGSGRVSLSSERMLQTAEVLKDIKNESIDPNKVFELLRPSGEGSAEVRLLLNHYRLDADHPVVTAQDSHAILALNPVDGQKTLIYNKDFVFNREIGTGAIVVKTTSGSTFRYDSSRDFIERSGLFSTK